MLVRSILTIACITTVGFSAALAETKPRSAFQQNLKSPSEFRSIANQEDRSRAIFTELGKLLTNPRCMNCHPAGDHPLQGTEHREHLPPVWRGEAGAGVPGASCAMCHTGSNFTLHEAATYQSIPGHPRWQLAPLSMSWEGKTLGDICRQLKDTNRNGGRDLAALQEHVAKDDLVAWGWNPGPGREPAPGSQESAGELFQAWIDSGAHFRRIERADSEISIQKLPLASLECPLWVISGHFAVQSPCPLYPQNRTLIDACNRFATLNKAG